MASYWTLVGGLLATMVLSLTAASRPQALTPRLFDVTPAHVVVDGGPLKPTDVFAPYETPIYVSFRCDGCVIGTVITSSWWYAEQEPPLRFATGSMTAEATEDFGEFHYDLPPGTRWSLGTYRIELRVDGVIGAEATFRVAVDTLQPRHRRVERRECSTGARRIDATLQTRRAVRRRGGATGFASSAAET